MNENQKAAYIFSQSACALIEAMGMAAENKQREHRGESMAYVENSFLDLMNKYAINDNDVVGYFRMGE